MAFDTVIDKAKLEGAITASANAIREKTGETALIPWLEDKGFAEAIAAIEAGGVDFGSGVNVLQGTTTPNEDMLTLDIGQSLPSNKTIVLIVVSDPFSGYSRAITYGFFIGNYKLLSGGYTGNASGSATVTLSIDLATGVFTCSNTYWLFSSLTYHWMVLYGN